MNRVIKKLVATVVAITLAMTVVVIPTVPAKAATGTVTFTIERMTIGQGFYLEPTQISINAGDTVKTVFDRAMQSINGGYTAEATADFNLQSIDGADTKILDIPQQVMILPSHSEITVDANGIERQIFYDAPSNLRNTGNKLANNALGEGSYSIMAKWIFMVNNAEVIEPANKVTVKDGDVIRLCFSVYGDGADLGFYRSPIGRLSRLTLANKDSLMKEIAAVNAKKSYWTAYPNVKAAYDSAVVVATTYNPGQNEVDAAYTALANAKSNPTYPTVKKAKIKSVKALAGRKVKITMKKIEGIDGYQYKYSWHNKVKKATKKVTTKKTLKTKAIKKGTKCYVKVRGYVKINKEKIYGKWSKIKSVTLVD